MNKSQKIIKKMEKSIDICANCFYNEIKLKLLQVHSMMFRKDDSE